MSDKNNSDVDLVAELVRHEGLRTKPYRCTQGKLTIGVGRNLDDNGISEAEAMQMLRNDIYHCKEDLKRSIPVYETLDDRRKDVLINMCFNLGITRLRGFKKMFAALERGDFIAASDEMLDSRWARQVGKRSQELAAKMNHYSKGRT